MDAILRFPELLEHRLAEVVSKLPDDDGRYRGAYQQLALHSQSDSLLQYQNKAAELGALSGVDGAIVLTQHLNLWGFGAEVLCQESPDERCWPARDEAGLVVLDDPIPFTRYGTRHRAAFRLCRELPEALCIVVSQDGAVKAVFNHDQKVAYYDNIERDLAQ